jgi:1-acyl-sn-glycerol-3-phosphate acyltransferase
MNQPALRAIALATFLTLVPITLLVPGLTELVVDTHGGTRFQAHLFVSLNQIAGIIAVPIAMLLHRRWPATRWWILGLLAVDAVAFLGMRSAPTLGALFAWRALDGIAHLPAVTFLMIAANRAGGRRRGASLGVVASALMVGVGVGAPLGGVLIDRDPMLVYSVGAVLLVVAALTSLMIPVLAAPSAAGALAKERSRYAFDRRRPLSWMPLAYGFADRFLIGVFVSTFTLFLTEVHGVSAASRGMLMSLFLLPFALLSWPAGKLADRVGWFAPLITGNILFGFVYASYGVLPFGWLPVAMVASGILSAMMFAPSLVLVSDLARDGAGEGLFGVFQVAGSIGFLAGPLVGGVLVEVLRADSGAPAWAMIFAVVGLALTVLGIVSAGILRPYAARHVPSVPSVATVTAPLEMPAVRRGGVVNAPFVPSSVATRGNAFTRGFGLALMRLSGWRFTGENFPDVKKFVLIVAPHTSNWDFVVGVMAKITLGLSPTFLGKDTLFKFPLGILMRYLGGFPVDRSSKSDVVSQTAALIANSEKILIALAPEGTRKAMPRWRSGFWWIAQRSQLPILPVVFDFSTKCVHIYPLYTLTGDQAKDVATLRSLYRSTMAYNPKKYVA